MSRPKRILLWIMSVFYVFAGVMHFVNPGLYMPMMPPYLPWHLELVYLSGVAEIVLGLAVLVPAWRRLAAWGIILLLIAIFPANLHIALYNVPIGGASEGAGALNWVRLPFQLVLIVWAWWYTRPDPS
ncbi:MAG: DoxX family protein [Deltaproteobacteria bacterium]|nr:DoxX family protein [Deltaproteobacteria bacterium]